MLVVPPAYAGYLTAAGARQGSQHVGPPVRPGVLSVLAHGLAEAVVERQRRTTLALLITRLPAGWCATDRDAAGRESYVGPACALQAHTTPAVLR